MSRSLHVFHGMRTAWLFLAIRTAWLFLAMLTALPAAIGPGTALAQEDENPRPLLHFPLDEGEGAVAHNRGRLDAQGTIVDGFWSRDGEEAVLDFNGRTTRVEIPHDERLNLTDAVTLGAWVNVVNPDGARGVLSKGRGTYAGYNFSIIHGRLTFEAYLDPGEGRERVRVQSGKILRPREWTHVAAAFDGTEGRVRFYADGEEIATREVPQGTIAYDPPLGDHDYARMQVTISGKAPFPHVHHQMIGFVRHAKVFDRPLSPDEIRREFERHEETARIEAATRREQRTAGYDCRLDLRVSDAEAGGTTPARVTVSGADGTRYFPRDDFSYGNREGGHFYTFGSSELKLPSGRYEITVRKGFEFEPLVSKVELAAGESRDLELTLSRWIDLPARGWYCGDEELQAIGHTEKPYDPRLSGEQIENSWRICMAEGLNWFHFVRGMPQSSVRLGPRTLAGSGVETYNRLLGDVICLNTFPGNRGLFEQLSTLDEVAARDGAATYAERLSGDIAEPVRKTSPRGLPVAVALEKAHLWRYAFRGEEPIGYRFLNLGFRFASSGGTDTYLNNPASRIAPGKYRVYTRLDRLNWASIQQAYRDQELFVSEGPFVLLEAGGTGPGGTLDVSSGRKIICRVEAGHYAGLQRVELVHNGRRAHVWEPDDDRQTVSLECGLRIEGPGWLAARVTGRQGRSLGNWAHTAPVYLDVPGETIEPDPDDARFFLQWLDRLEEAIAGLAEREGRPESDYADYRSDLDRARAVYEGFLE